MRATYYVKYQKHLKEIAKQEVPDGVKSVILDVSIWGGDKRRMIFKKVEGAVLFDNEAIFLYDADIELKP